MDRLSTTTRQQVKQKPQNISALPDSVNHQLKIQAVEEANKSANTQGLKKSDPGAPDRFELKLDLPVMCARRDGKGLSLTARYIVAIIEGYCGVGCWGFLSEDTISRAARCGRARVGRAIKEAEAAKYIEVNDRGKCNKYYIPPLVKRIVKVWVNPALVRDDGFSIVRAVWASLVKFRQGDNEVTWLTHRKAAEVLGVSYATIYRAAARCAVLGDVVKDHRPWRRSSKNSYALTCKADLTIGVSGLESARAKRGALGQTSKEGRYFNANSVLNGRFRVNLGLSFDSRQDGAAYESLHFIGVHWCVARSIAVEWRADVDSVSQMVKNGIFRRDDYLHRVRRSGVRPCRFNLAGYVVKGLNMAKTEGHGIRPSKLVEKGQVKGDDQGKVVTFGCHSEAEFEHRREEMKRRLLSKPAKPGPPKTEAELALIASRRDLSEEAEDLRSAQRAAGSRYYIGRKWMKSPAKTWFSFGL